MVFMQIRDEGNKVAEEKAGREHRADGKGRKETQEERSRPGKKHYFKYGGTASTETVSLNC